MGSLVMNENKSTRYTEFIVDTINLVYFIILVHTHNGTWKEM